MKNLAIIDLGSNSVRLSVNRINADGTYQEVKWVRKDCRLAERMGSRKILQPRAIQQTIQVLQEFKKICRTYPHLQIVGIATAAVREATNQQAFLQRVKDLTGVTVHVLTGVQEADCDYLGVRDHVKTSRYVIMDVGGGSIELIYVHNHQKELISLPFGAVTLTERFHLDNQISVSDWFAALKYFNRQLQAISWLNRVPQRIPLILVGGAHRTLVKMMQQRGTYQSNSTMKKEQVFTIYRQLLAKNLIQRQNIPGLEKRRASVIVGGLLPLMVLTNRFDFQQIEFVKTSAQNGFILNLLAGR